MKFRIYKSTDHFRRNPEDWLYTLEGESRHEVWSQLPGGRYPVSIEEVDKRIQEKK